MAKALREWIEDDVRPVRNRPLRWLSERHFFRDPMRPVYTDPSYFFSPADGVILYQACVKGQDALVEIKGQPYSLQTAMRDSTYDRESLVIGIFMTLFDVHVNRVPYRGRLSYTPLPPIETMNRPMLDVERDLVDALRVDVSRAEFLHANQRVLNRVYAPDLGQNYYILQIADYDVNKIVPFQLDQNCSVGQGQRFSQIRFGSQVDLIIPLSPRCEFSLLQTVGMHVEAGMDKLVRITPTGSDRRDGADANGGGA
jgi:phosphatidylserine decarboxylase